MIPLETVPTPDSVDLPSPPLTVTHLLEHLYCPRFTFFEHVLEVPERQERRGLVMKGRDVHRQRSTLNPGYLRKKLGVTAKQTDVPLASAALGLRGVADEVLTLADGGMAPLDYKYAEYKGQVYDNHRMQSVAYAALIREAFANDVRRGYLCFTRSNSRVIEIEYTEEDFTRLESILAEILEVIRTGLFPRATRWKARCRDCCYRNICIQ